MLKTLRRKFVVTAMGLAIARALAENLHGSLSVETPGETDLEFVARFP